MERPTPPSEYDKPYKRALVAFFEQDMTFGSLITHEWMYEHMGLKDPDACTSGREFKQAQFEYMANVERMREYLIENHNMHLRSVWAKGYEVVHPGDQTPWAMNECAKELKECARKTKIRLVNIEIDLLTDGQRAENLEAIGKLGFFERDIRISIL